MNKNNISAPPPSFDALMEDLLLEQKEALQFYCRKHQIPVKNFIAEAILEAQWHYLSQHQAEAGNEWMGQELKKPLFRQYQ